VANELRVGDAIITLERGDITTVEADAIVNAANSGLMGGGGVDGAIHNAGGDAILEECRKYVDEHGTLPPGKAMLTHGGDLPAEFVIHTVGPKWHGGMAGEAETLTSAYLESLRVADHFCLETIAFPSISTGAFGYPKEQAAPTALKAVRRYLTEAECVRHVRFVLYDMRTYETYADALDTLTM
jgi:O-acetyl-ADP-ribose deacetylase (regulator of RNase III)